MNWGTYLARWQTMYRKRLTYRQWVRAGFAMPWIPGYYRQVFGTLVYSIPPLAAMRGIVRRRRPQTDHL